jgi:hypothetical protein
VATTTALSIMAGSVAATIVLLIVAVALPGAPDPIPRTEDRRRVRLLSRVLFLRRQTEAITLDCLLVAVEDAAPGVDAPEGLPFTLQLLTPDTQWFADRINEVLTTWADECREMHVELREEHGKILTRLESGASTINLELAGAAGLHLTAP